jgi:hypothetical protein
MDRIVVVRETEVNGISGNIESTPGRVEPSRAGTPPDGLEEA